MTKPRSVEEDAAGIKECGQCDRCAERLSRLVELAKLGEWLTEYHEIEDPQIDAELVVYGEDVAREVRKHLSNQKGKP